jgi:hypothetical protein
LVKVRAELAIQRKGIANLEEREASIISRMTERQATITALVEADMGAGLQAPAAPETAAAHIEAEIAGLHDDAQPNGEARF